MRTLRVVAGAVVAVACLLAWSPVWAENEEAEQKAVDAAKAWLALVDAGRFGESWDTAASFFRYAVSKEKWDARLVNSRVPLGRVLSRKIDQKKYVKDLPDAPKGEYVVIIFKTAFDGMPVAFETITPYFENGTWRVCGYAIKPPGH